MSDLDSQTSRSLRELCEEIKARIDYRSFYLRYCSEPARVSDTRLFGRCPLPHHGHSGRGHPSFSVDLQRGLFHCFSRDEGGDVIRFYELMHAVSFRSAVKALACDLSINSTEQNGTHHRVSAQVKHIECTASDTNSTEQLQILCERFLKICRREEQTEGINYLARRGINAQTMVAAGVTYFPRRAYRRVMQALLDDFSLDELQQSGLFNEQGRLTFYSHRLLFPFYFAKRVVYLQARTTASGVEPRWHNMRGAIPSLYNADALCDLKSGDIVYLVEGFTDTLTLIEHDFAAVGIVGAGGFREEWVPELARFNVVAALDPDKAGERAFMRYAEMFAARGLRLARIKLPTDVNDFFQRNAAAAVDLKLLSEAALEQV